MFATAVVSVISKMTCAGSTSCVRSSPSISASRSASPAERPEMLTSNVSRRPRRFSSASIAIERETTQRSIAPIRS
jgi:hypothetical protein